MKKNYYQKPFHYQGKIGTLGKIKSQEGLEQILGINKELKEVLSIEEKKEEEK